MSNPRHIPSVNALPCGFFELDEANRVLVWNQRMEQWTRRNEAEVAGQSLTELFPEAGGAGKVLARVRATGQPQVLSQILHQYFLPVPLPANHLSGFSHMQQECYVTPVPERPGHIAVTITDVTAHVVGQARVRAVHRELAEARERLEIVARRERAENRIRQILLHAEGDAMFDQVLRQVREMFSSPFGFFGYIRESDGALVAPSLTVDVWEQCGVVGKSVVFPRESWTGVWGRILRERIPLTKNDAHQTPAGHVKLHRSMGAPLLLEDELVGSIHIANRDRDYGPEDLELLSEMCRVIAPVLKVRLQRDRHEAVRRQAEADLLAAKDAAEAASRAKSEFLATMSHEIRTPMNGVIGFVQLLRETMLTDDQRMYVETIASSGEMLLTLINDILDFSKIESGKLQLESIPYDLDKIAGEVCGLLAVQSRTSGVPIGLKVAEGAPTQLTGDPGRVRQILLNLAGNALKFTKQGSVTIEVGIDAAGPDGSGGQGYLQVAVRDTGIGIPAEKLGILFQKFTQADSSTTRRFGGTGLGLAISKRLVELMGGRIGVESRVGEGSKFWFALPLLAQPRRPESPVPADRPVEKPLAEAPLSNGLISGAGATQPRVLVAEDNATNQLLASSLLKKLGCTVDVAVNGQEAVEMVERSSYDLVLMDCHMPVMNGLEAAREIRHRQRGQEARRVPIVALTASVLPEERGECITAGMDDFIAKPLRRADLARVVSQWTSTSPQFRP